jgi:membrane fusion protein (multidrug efflux system)
VSSQDAEDAEAAARQADAAVQQAAASLKSAEINLAYTRIVAPITGQIGRSAVTAGALVTANQATSLATIYQLDPIYVDITESSARLAQLRKALKSGSVQPAGADVSIVLDDGSIYGHPGRIEFSETEVDEATGAVTIRATVPNPDRQLLPGQFVRVTVNQGVLPDGILAPQQGVTRDSTGAAIALVVNADNKVEGRKLVTDRAIGDQWLVSSGLKSGDRLIVEGTDRVKPGQTVKIAPVALAKAK